MSDTYFDFENMEHNYKDTMNVKIGELMTKEVASIDLDMPCLKAASTMWLKRFRRIPVTHKGNWSALSVLAMCTGLFLNRV